jgi:hypothetical protein
MRRTYTVQYQNTATKEWKEYRTYGEEEEAVQTLRMLKKQGVENLRIWRNGKEVKKHDRQEQGDAISGLERRGGNRVSSPRRGQSHQQGAINGGNA